MPPPGHEKKSGILAVNLTEDANAMDPIPCGRQKAPDCSKLIQPEDERHYILNKNDLNGKGTLICSACYLYYENKGSTLRATCKCQPEPECYIASALLILIILQMSENLF